MRSRCAARSASNRCGAATPTTRPPACSTCSDRVSAGPPRCTTFLWLQTTRDGAGIHRRHPGRPAAGVHLRLRGGRFEISARPARRHRSAAVPLQRNRFRQGERVASRCGRCRGIARTARDAGLGVAGPDPAHYPERRVGATEPGHSRRARRLPVGARPAVPRGGGHVAPGGKLDRGTDATADARSR